MFGLGRKKGGVKLSEESRQQLVERFQLAQAAGDRGEWEEALNLTRQVMALRPEFPDGLFLMSRSLHALGRTKEAQALLGPMIKSAPYDGELQFLFADTAQARGQWGAAMKAWEQALRSTPANQECAQRFMDCAIKSKKLVKAARTLKELAVQTGLPGLMSQAAELYYKANMPKEAEAAAQAALAMPVPQVERGITQSAGPTPPSAELEDAFSALTQFTAPEPEKINPADLLEGSEEDAMVDLEALARKLEEEAPPPEESQTGELANSSSLNQAETGQTDNSLSGLLKIEYLPEFSPESDSPTPPPAKQKIDDDDDKLFVDSAYPDDDQDDLPMAIPSPAPPAPGTDKLETQTIIEQATECLAQGAAEAAVDLLRSHPDAYADDVSGIRLLAMAYGQLGDPRAALEAYQSLLVLMPDATWALYQAACLAFELERGREASDLLARATAIDPLYVEAWAKLGSVADYLGQLDEACDAYQTAWGLGWQAEETLLRLAHILENRNELEPAGKIYLQLLAQSPDSYEALLGAGRLASAQGRHGQALVFLEQCRQVSPEDLDALRLLAKTYGFLERWNDAAGLWALLITFVPQDQEAQAQLRFARTQLAPAILS